jgi:hypothetical protein
MSKTITITFSDSEFKALEYVAVSAQDWTDNAVHERCRIAIDEIVGICVEKCIQNNIQIPGSKDEIVLLCFEQGWVKSAAQRNQEAITAMSN